MVAKDLFYQQQMASLKNNIDFLENGGQFSDREGRRRRKSVLTLKNQMEEVAEEINEDEYDSNNCQRNSRVTFRSQRDSADNDPPRQSYSSVLSDQKSQ